MAMAGTSDGPPTYACCRAMAGVVDVRWALPGTCCLQLHGQLETCGHPLGAQRQAHAFHGQIVPGQLEDMSMAATAANLVAGTLRHLWHEMAAAARSNYRPSVNTCSRSHEVQSLPKRNSPWARSAVCRGELTLGHDGHSLVVDLAACGMHCHG